MVVLLVRMYPYRDSVAFAQLLGVPKPLVWMVPLLLGCVVVVRWRREVVVWISVMLIPSLLSALHVTN